MTLSFHVESYRLQEPDEDIEEEDDDDDDRPADSNITWDDDDDDGDDEDEEEDEETWQVAGGNDVPLKAGAGLTSPTKSA